MPVLVRTRRLGTEAAVKPAEVRRRAERMLRGLGLSDRELSIVLCDDGTIRQLNRHYRGERKATDVLAFPLGEPGTAWESPLLGDIVISVPTARRQANKRGRTVIDEVTMLLAHGLLHLLGFDHRTRPEERRMNALTDGLRATAGAGRRGRRASAGGVRARRSGPGRSGG